MGVLRENAHNADFSNTVTKSQIEEMATVDEYEVVKEVQVGPSPFESTLLCERI